MSNSFCKYLPKTAKINNNPKKIVNRNTKTKKFISKVTSQQYVPPLIKKSFVTQELNFNEANILDIDVHIQEKLKSNISNIVELQQDLENIIKGKNSNSTSEEDILRKRIRDLEGSCELIFYLIKTSSIIEEYTKLCSNTKKKSFIKTKESFNDTDSKKKDDLILKYKTIAQNYVPIELSQQTQKLICSECDGTIFAVQDTHYICQKCAHISKTYDLSPTYKDNDRINRTNRYTYTRKGHFIEAISKFQGEQNTTIKEEVYKKLRQEIYAHNLTPQTVTKDQVYMFIGENGLSKHYEDINLIYYVLTGVKPPDISKDVRRLIDMFEVAERIYDLIKDPDRTNSLAVNYKLLKLLQLLGYPFKKSDFYTLKTDTILEEHDEIWRKICAMTGWDFIPTI